MFAITSRVHHEFEEYTTQFQDKQSCQNESETVRSCHMKTATDPRSFRKDTRQCTTELPIRAIPPTISHEAERLLPLRFVEGSQMPAGANKRAEFPAALPETKNPAKQTPAPQRTEIPGERKQARPNPPSGNLHSGTEEMEGPELAGSYRRAAEDAATARRERGRGNEGTHRLCSKAMNGRLLGFISSSSRTRRAASRLARARGGGGV